MIPPSKFTSATEPDGINAAEKRGRWGKNGSSRGSTHNFLFEKELTIIAPRIVSETLFFASQIAKLPEQFADDATVKIKSSPASLKPTEKCKSLLIFHRSSPSRCGYYNKTHFTNV